MLKSCFLLLALIQVSILWIPCKGQGIGVGFMQIPDISLTPKLLSQNAPLIIGDLDFFMQQTNLDDIANFIFNQEERAREIKEELKQRETNFKITSNSPPSSPTLQEQKIQSKVLPIVKTEKQLFLDTNFG